MKLPDSTQVVAGASLARDLLAATRTLPNYRNHDFYDPNLQQEVYDHIHDSCEAGFEWLIAELQLRLEQAPYCARVKGLQFDDGHGLLVAVNRAFGTLVARPYDPRTPRAQLIHYIQPTTDKIARSGGWTYSEQLHTDGAERPVPFRYLSMQCVRPDSFGGGYSRFLDIDALFDMILEAGGIDLLNCLQEQPVPWKIGEYLGGGIVWVPVLQAGMLRWRRYTIEDALVESDIVLPREIIQALDRLESIIAKHKRIMEYFLETQDFVIMDNWRCLHGRTPIDNPNSKRLMLRAWVQA